MKREFLINILLLVGINLLIKPIYIFGIDRQVQNAVGTDTFGLYFAVFNFAFLLQIINDFGIQVFNSRHIAQNRDLLKRYFPNVLLLKTMLAAVYLLVVFLTAIPAGYATSEYLPFLWAIGVIHILNSLILYLRSNISGLGWYRTDSWLSSLSKLLMILVCGPLLWWPYFRSKFQIDWFIYAQILTLAITILVAIWLTRKEVIWRGWQLDLSFLKRIAKETYPYALAIFLMTVYTRVDAVMIERMLPDGKAEAGIYAGAYRLLDASNMIGFLFAGLLLPMFARMLKEQESVSELLVFSFQMIMAGALALTIPVYFFQEEIMILMYDEGTTYWGVVLGHLMLSFVAGCAIYVYSALLTANDSLSAMNYVFVLGVLLNIALNAWLIPIEKAAGAAIATLATQCFIAISLILLAIRIFNLSINWKMTFRLLIYATAIVGSSLLIELYLMVDWRYKFILMGLGAIVLAFIFRLINLKVLFERFPGK